MKTSCKIGSGGARSDRRRTVVTVLVGAIFLLALAHPVRAQYNYTIVDPLRGDDLVTGIDHDFWEPYNAPGGTEAGYFSISPDGLVLGSFSVYLGMLPGPQLAKWALAGDFRVSFFFQSSPYPGGYGNRIHVNIYEVAATPDELCGTFVYGPLFPREGFGGLWTGYSSPPAHTYYNPGYGEAAFYLFVKTGGTLKIYRNTTAVSEDPSDEVFSGDYLNPSGRFVFMLGTGGPNSGWIRVRDVVIETEDLVACDASTEVPDKWVMSSDEDGDGVSNDLDQCPGTAAGSTVDGSGCSIEQIAPCDGDWKNHGDYVSGVVKAAQAFLSQGLLSEEAVSAIVSAAARSSCGKK